MHYSNFNIFFRMFRETSINSLKHNKTMHAMYFVEVNEKIEIYNSIIGYYVIPLIGLAGFLLNVSCFIFAVKLRKKGTYCYLKSKFMVNFAVCLLACGFQHSRCSYCSSTVYNVLILQIFRVYFLKILTS